MGLKTYVIGIRMISEGKILARNCAWIHINLSWKAPVFPVKSYFSKSDFFVEARLVGDPASITWPVRSNSKA